MKTKINKAISKLEEARGKEKMSSQLSDVDIIDIWNADERTWNKQNYFFVGSRGSGKTTLVDKSQASILDTNRKQLTKVVPCVFRCSSVARSSDEATPRINNLQNFLVELFTELKIGIDQFSNRNIISRWLSNRGWYRIVDSIHLGGEAESQPHEPGLSRFRLRLKSNIGVMGFTLLEMGPFINVGKFQFQPLQITYEHEKAYDSQLLVDGDELDSIHIDRQVQEAVKKLIRKMAIEIGQNGIEHVIVFIDDFHFVPLDLQIEIIDALQTIASDLEALDIALSFKIFSGIDTLTEIALELGYSKSKEILPKNIEASLDRIDGKRRAMENLLIRVLTSEKEFTEAEVHALFPREVIDLIVVLSGGHPRRFLEICSEVLGKTGGVQDNQLHNKIMLSSAEVRNAARKELVVQLGMRKGRDTNQYQQWYIEIIQKTVEWTIENNSPFIAIPQTEMRNNYELAQWIRDAVAVGDFLEIIDAYPLNGDYKYLLALNPATIYDFFGKIDTFAVEYHHIIEIQRGSREHREELGGR